MRYIFCILAILIQPFFSYMVYKKQDKRQAALKMPMLYMSGAYLVIQIYVFFRFCRIIPEDYQIWSYLIQAAILIVFILIEVMLLGSNVYINRVEKAEQDSIADFKNLLTELEVCRVRVKDADSKMLLDSLYEKMRYADPVSSPAVASENKKIQELLQGLPSISDKEIFKSKCDEISDLLEIRKIKNTKR